MFRRVYNLIEAFVFTLVFCFGVYCAYLMVRQIPVYFGYNTLYAHRFNERKEIIEGVGF